MQNAMSDSNTPMTTPEMEEQMLLAVLDGFKESINGIYSVSNKIEANDLSEIIMTHNLSKETLIRTFLPPP